MSSLNAAVAGFVAGLAGDVSPTTRAWYAKRLTAFVEYATRDGPICVRDVTGATVRAYRAYLLDRGLSAHTVHGHQRALRRFGGWLVAEGLAAANVAAAVPLIRLPAGPPKAVEDDDLERMLAHLPAESARDRAVVLLLIDTGCRVGGLCSITLGGLDLRGGCALVSEKGGRGRRVYFTAMTAAALADYLAVRPSVGHDTLFVAERGGAALGGDGVRHMLRRLGRRAGVRGRVNPHAFRHAFARWYLRNGGNLPMLGRTLGHAPGSPVTARYYAVFEDEELQEFHGRYSPLATRAGRRRSGD